MPGRALVVESVAAEAIGQTQSAEPKCRRRCRHARVCRRAPRCVPHGRRRLATRIYFREDLRPGDVIAGPAIIKEPIATTVVEPEWRAVVTSLNHLVLERTQVKAARAHAIGTTADPVLLKCSTTCSWQSPSRWA